MVRADENTPIAGSGQGKAKAAQRGNKAAQPDKTSGKRSRKPRQKAEAKPDQLLPEAHEPVAAPIAAVEAAASEVAAASEASDRDISASDVFASEVVASEVSATDVAPAEPPQPAPVSYQAIASAYGDYTRKSIEQTSAFFEQLAGVRSLSKALELQTEYARQACETFVAQSQRIRELHREMTWQRLKRFEGLMTGMTRSK